MIRAALLNPILLAVVAVVGFGLCRCVGVDPHPREMLGALVVGLFASMTATALLVRSTGSAVALNRSALVSTVYHLIVMAAGAVVVVLMGPNRLAAVVWILISYWATLAGVAASAVSLVKASAGRLG